LAVSIIADTVQFVGPREGASGAAAGQRSGDRSSAEGGFESADDIPF
jgi:hypothetical protein